MFKTVARPCFVFAAALLAGMAQAAPSELKTTVVYPGATLEIRARSTGESLECPSDLPACPADAAISGPIVLDPGHNDTNAGTRSDPSYIEPSSERGLAETAPRKVQYYEPYEGHAKPSSHWTPLREDERQPLDPKAGFSPYIHEGRGNLAVSILAKAYLDRCVFKKLGSAPAVKLTRWPGESVYGQYENPSWAARARERVGGEPFVMAESKFEHLNKKDDTASIRYDYNSNWGTPYNSRQSPAKFVSEDFALILYPRTPYGDEQYFPADARELSHASHYGNALDPRVPDDRDNPAGKDYVAGYAALGSPAGIPVRTQTSGDLMVSHAIGTQRKVLHERGQMRGGVVARRSAEQKKSGDWRIEFSVTPKGKNEGVEPPVIPALRMSDEEIQVAKRKTVFYAQLYCGKKQR